MRFAISALALALTGLLPVSAPAQTYPSRTVSVIVPFPAGGSVDGVARILVAKLNETVGQHFIVENRAGGASARSAPTPSPRPRPTATRCCSLLRSTSSTRSSTRACPTTW